MEAWIFWQTDGDASLFEVSKTGKIIFSFGALVPTNRAWVRCDIAIFMDSSFTERFLVHSTIIVSTNVLLK